MLSIMFNSFRSISGLVDLSALTPEINSGQAIVISKFATQHFENNRYNSLAEFIMDIKL